MFSERARLEELQSPRDIKQPVDERLPTVPVLVVVELVERDPRLAGQVDKRGSKEPEGNSEQHRDSPLMLDGQQRACEGDDDKQCYEDRAYRSKQYRVVQELRAPFSSAEDPP
jgi:hypothetical protein